MREVRRAARIAGFGALTGAMLPAFLAHERLTRGARARRRARGGGSGRGAGACCGSSACGRIVQGRRRRQRGRGHLVVANHRSTADILVLLRTFGGRMVSRADLAGWPLVGAAARAVGTLFVDRSDAASGATAVRAIRTRLVAGDTVIVFPEGTTFPDDEVRPFHAGAFVAARAARARTSSRSASRTRRARARRSSTRRSRRTSRGWRRRAPSRVAVVRRRADRRARGEGAPRCGTRRTAEVQRLVREARGG